MIISPPFLPTPDADDPRYVAAAMPDSIDIAPGSGGAPAGSFPVTTAMTWHNGLHIQAPRDAHNQPLPVRAIADGTVIFMRAPRLANTTATDAQNYNPYGNTPAWTDNGIVIVRHTTDIGAAGNTPTTVTYYSVYMHLSYINAAVEEKKPIWRKNVIGKAGQIYGRDHQIHFEICLNPDELQKLMGVNRPTTWGDPATAPTADGRTDAVFGSLYVYLPAGTPIRTAAPTSHLRNGGPATGASATTGHFVPNTLQAAQWVEVRYQQGNGTVSSYRASDGTGGLRIGDPLGQPHPERDFEYNLYTEANKRHTNAVAGGATSSSPSGWYELLRFGRNLGPDPLPADAAHWREIPAPNGTVWADLNAPGTFKFSDADFPAFKDWQCFGDDPSPQNQRCDSTHLKRTIRDPLVPESILERKALARRLSDSDVRRKLERAICRFPTEWDKTTITDRYEWLKVDEEFRVEEGDQWNTFKTHAESISFEGLPQEYKDAVWHIHPRSFIAHMRQCGWLSSADLSRTLKAAPAIGVSRAESLRLPMNVMMRKYCIATYRIREAHFLAQVGHETGWWQYREEIGNERYFRTMYEVINVTEAAQDYRSGLAQRLNLLRRLETEQAYAARRPADVLAKARGMDNGQANAIVGGMAGDGPRFRGRGFLQITGRRNYSIYSSFRGRNFTADPNPRLLASDDGNACDASGFYWSREKANHEADQGANATNVNRVGGIVNRGNANSAPLHSTERNAAFIKIWSVLNDSV